MSNTGKKKPLLVAGKRVGKPKAKPAAKPKPKPKPKPKAKVKPAVKRRKAAPKRRSKVTRRKGTRSRNPLVRLIRAIVRMVFRVVWGIGWRVSAIVLVILGLAVGYTYTTLPDLEELLDGRARGSVTLLDREGEVFAWRGDQFGGVVTSDTVSKHLANAVVATEDKRFYWHPGVDPIGIATAIRINLREGRGPLSGHGGSTLTQQTAKLLCLGREYEPDEWETEADYVADCRRGSLTRKAKEAVYAMAMEAKYSKADILSIYLNRAYMGGGAFGAEAAADLPK